MCAVGGAIQSECKSTLNYRGVGDAVNAMAETTADDAATFLSIRRTDSYRDATVWPQYVEREIMAAVDMTIAEKVTQAQRTSSVDCYTNEHEKHADKLVKDVVGAVKEEVEETLQTLTTEKVGDILGVPVQEAITSGQLGSILDSRHEVALKETITNVVNQLTQNLHNCDIDESDLEYIIDDATRGAIHALTAQAVGSVVDGKIQPTVDHVRASIQSSLGTTIDNVVDELRGSDVHSLQTVVRSRLANFRSLLHDNLNPSKDIIDAASTAKQAAENLKMHFSEFGEHTIVDAVASAIHSALDHELHAHSAPGKAIATVVSQKSIYRGVKGAVHKMLRRTKQQEGRIIGRTIIATSGVVAQNPEGRLQNKGGTAVGRVLSSQSTGSTVSDTATGMRMSSSSMTRTGPGGTKILSHSGMPLSTIEGEGTKKSLNTTHAGESDSEDDESDAELGVVGDEKKTGENSGFLGGALTVTAAEAFIINLLRTMALNRHKPSRYNYIVALTLATLTSFFFVLALFWGAMLAMRNTFSPTGDDLVVLREGERRKVEEYRAHATKWAHISSNIFVTLLILFQFWIAALTTSDTSGQPQ
eukprot:m.176372 g.176372  ORF g.176372 m.176372 type:complete len:588 (-) comp14899_c0_seq1:8-1771(-)